MRSHLILLTAVALVWSGGGLSLLACERCDGRPQQTPCRQCGYSDDRGLLDLLDSAAGRMQDRMARVKLPTLPRPFRSRAEASCGCELAPSCGCEIAPNCGCEIEPSCGCERAPSCGCEMAPSCGCELKPSCGCEMAPHCGCEMNAAQMPPVGNYYSTPAPVPHTSPAIPWNQPLPNRQVESRPPQTRQTTPAWPVPPAYSAPSNTGSKPWTYGSPTSKEAVPQQNTQPNHQPHSLPRTQQSPVLDQGTLPDSQVDPFRDDSASRIRRLPAQTIQFQRQVNQPRSAQPAPRSYGQSYDPQASHGGGVHLQFRDNPSQDAVVTNRHSYAHQPQVPEPEAVVPASANMLPGRLPALSSSRRIVPTPVETPAEQPNPLRGSYR